MGSSRDVWKKPRTRRGWVLYSVMRPLVLDRLHLGHHLGDEVVRFLLDAGADLEALERHDLGVLTLQQLLDARVRVLDERLAAKGDLAERLAQSALDHARDDLGGLALPLRLLGEDGTLARHDLGGHLRGAQVARVAGGDVHRQIVRQARRAAPDRHQRADARAVHIGARRRSSMVSPDGNGTAASSASVVRPAARAACATAWAKARKSCSRATKSVSQLISTMAAVRASAERATTTTPSAATRVAFLSAFARPWRRMSSAAASRSPLVSTSARLHSIMPAPVRSRSCLTASAVIFMARSLSPHWADGALPAPRTLRRAGAPLGRRTVSGAGSVPAAATGSTSSSASRSSSSVATSAGTPAGGLTAGSLRRAGTFLRTAGCGRRAPRTAFLRGLPASSSSTNSSSPTAACRTASVPSRTASAMPAA